MFKWLRDYIHAECDFIINDLYMDLAREEERSGHLEDQIKTLREENEDLNNRLQESQAVYNSMAKRFEDSSEIFKKEAVKKAAETIVECYNQPTKKVYRRRLKGEKHDS